eukprot:SAG31_NODE_1073_length_10065_cov_2.176701_12_plen_110_part_00
MEGGSSRQDFEWRLEADAIEDGVYQGRPGHSRSRELDEWQRLVRLQPKVMMTRTPVQQPQPLRSCLAATLFAPSPLMAPPMRSGNDRTTRSSSRWFVAASRTSSARRCG